MFVFTFRKGGLRRLAAVCLCGAAIVGAAAAGIAWNRAQSTPANAAAAGLTQQITGSQDLAAFLAGYGVEVDPTSAEVMAVKVPRKWDESFEAFHAVVQQSGLNLEKCKGKQVDKWTVPVPAMCDDAKKTYAVVLVYKNEPKGRLPAGKAVRRGKAAGVKPKRHGPDRPGKGCGSRFRCGQHGAEHAACGQRRG